jgi:hypothetical protein
MHNYLKSGRRLECLVECVLAGEVLNHNKVKPGQRDIWISSPDLFCLGVGPDGCHNGVPAVQENPKNVCCDESAGSC